MTISQYGTNEVVGFCGFYLFMYLFAFNTSKLEYVQKVVAFK